MNPTRAQVKALYWSLLDDPAGQVFVDTPTISVFQPAFQMAYDALWRAYLSYQVPRITNIVANIAVGPMVTSLTPADMGISNFGDYEYLSERPFGSQDHYQDLWATDRLTQRAMTNRLMEFVYRNDTFYFVGATQLVELQICYETSGAAPTLDNQPIISDGCLSFLANFAASISGPLKGYDERAQTCGNFAVGPKYAQGIIGGELFRLVQALVRSRQHVQLAQKPYTTSRRLGIRRAVPYVAAQFGTTGGGPNLPLQFSTATGSIFGAIDGTNAIFVVAVGGVAGMNVYNGGLLQTQGVDYTRISNQITFAPGAIPTPGAIITAEVFINFP